MNNTRPVQNTPKHWEVLKALIDWVAAIEAAKEARRRENKKT